MPKGFALWLMIIATGTVISEWIEHALKDGKVTLLEAADLVDRLGKVWGFSVELDVPLPSFDFAKKVPAPEGSELNDAKEPERKVPKVE